MQPDAYTEFAAWLLECRGAPAPEWESLRSEVKAWDMVVKLATDLDEAISRLHGESGEPAVRAAFVDASRLAGFVLGVETARKWENT